MLALGQTGQNLCGVRGHSRNDSHKVLVSCVLSRTYGNPANPVNNRHLRIKRALLYQLSYAPTFASI
jgi:hypothetical protein